MESDRVSHLVAYLASRDYSTADLKYAADVLPEDEELNAKHRYGKHFTPGDVRRVVDEARLVRRRVTKPLTREEARRIVKIEPELTRGDIEELPHDKDRRFIVTDEALARVFDTERTGPGKK